jgi:hypothetical protein
MDTYCFNGKVWLKKLSGVNAPAYFAAEEVKTSFITLTICVNVIKHFLFRF